MYSVLTIVIFDPFPSPLLFVLYFKFLPANTTKNLTDLTYPSPPPTFCDDAFDCSIVPCFFFLSVSKQDIWLEDRSAGRLQNTREHLAAPAAFDQWQGFYGAEVAAFSC